jgi:hypothetical protein
MAAGLEDYALTHHLMVALVPEDIRVMVVLLEGIILMAVLVQAVAEAVRLDREIVVTMVPPVVELEYMERAQVGQVV